MKGSVLGGGAISRALLATLSTAVLVLAPAATSSTAGAQESPLTPEQEQWLDDRDRTVVLGTDDTYRPYVFFDDDGALTGITADYVELIEDRLNITIEARRLPDFGETLDAARAREIDIVPNVVVSDDRPFLTFTESFVTVVDRIIVRNEDASDYVLADLGGKRLASVDGYAVTDFIDESFSEIDVVRVASEIEGMRLLSLGEVDALVADLAVVSYAVEEQSITNLRVAGTVDSVSEQTFGVRSDLPELREILDAGLATITEAERGAIIDRWVQLGTQPASDSGAVLWVIGILATLSGLTAVLVLSWNGTLRRRVARKTEDLRHELEEHERTEAHRSRLELAIAQAAELVVVVDADWSVRYVNPTYERISGRDGRHLDGQALDSLFTMVDGRDTLHNARSVLSRDGIWHGKLALSGRDDSIVHVDGAFASYTLPSGDPGGFVGTLRDATREEDLQAELQRSERLRAIGTLAAGISHDFNNLLTPILSGAELAMNASDDEQRRTYLDSIQEAALRASDLVQRVRSFSMEQELQPTYFDLGAVVAEATTLVRHMCPDDVTFENAELAADLTLHADASQIHRLLMNLLTNALQAMESTGGRLRVELNRLPAARAELLVTDSGIGIDDHAQGRLFEPYYSTRSQGGGTGLGLFTVMGIVESLGGDIAFESEPGIGTAVRVTIPLPTEIPSLAGVGFDQTPCVADDLQRRDQPMPEADGFGPILVVDDDAAVLDVIVSMLRTLGHDAHGCASGRDALDAIDSGAPLRLLLTDLGMPDMRGDELARAAADRRPELGIVILTGNIEPEILAENWVVLAKPIRMADLDDAVRSAMTGSHHSL